MRDCVIWMDVRASKEAKDIYDTRDPAILAEEGPVPVENMPCKLLWIKRNDRESYDKADVFCEYQDWIMYKLTGSWCLNTSNVSGRWYYDVVEGKFPESLYRSSGLEEALDKFPKKIAFPGDNLGNISKAAADELGLSYDTQIVQGVVDSFASVIGMGIVKPGRSSFVTGSSHMVLTFIDKPLTGKGMGRTRMGGIIKGYGLVGGGQTSSGSILSWYKENFCSDLTLKGKAEGKSAYYYLDQDAYKIPPGSEGLLVLDWWQGNRSPYGDPNVRGMIYGLSLNHTRGHVFRAIMEGVAYGTENILTKYRNNGINVDELVVGGGVANSELFMQIHSDVSNVILNVPEETETPVIGDAILAAVGVGIYKDLDEAVKNMVRFKKVVWAKLR